jgi:putative mRNA 3-end processing factor
MSLEYGDGLRIETGGERFVADANDPGDGVALVSHAHGDHLYREPPAEAVWSDLTRALARVRRSDTALPARADHPAVDLFDAGHVPGSRAALVRGDRRILYTGDVCTRDRLYLDGFDPPGADVLVVESTYGTPEYVFPPVEETRTAFADWVAAQGHRPVICFGYALGRAQEIEWLLADTDRERILVSDAIADVDAVIADHLDVDLPGERYEDRRDLGTGDALVLPARLRGSWVDDLIESTGAATAGVSGWAVDDGFRFARDLNAGFVLSDHCDFRELLDLVRTVDPAEVYTLHGSADAFADRLTREFGYDATALKPNQTRLSQF